MNYIAALLLVVLERNEEKAFWVLVSLIDDDGRQCVEHKTYRSSQQLEEGVSLKEVASCSLENDSFLSVISSSTAKQMHLPSHFAASIPGKTRLSP